VQLAFVLEWETNIEREHKDQKMKAVQRAAADTAVGRVRVAPVVSTPVSDILSIAMRLLRIAVATSVFDAPGARHAERLKKRVEAEAKAEARDAQMGPKYLHRVRHTMKSRGARHTRASREAEREHPRWRRVQY
jgi:hypothetical protein